MKASEITIGDEYAYRAWKHSTTRRVRVTGTATIPGQSYAGPMSGWSIEFLDSSSYSHDPQAGDTRNVAGRTLILTWDEYERAEQVRKEVHQIVADRQKAFDDLQDAACAEMLDIFQAAGMGRPQRSMTFRATQLRDLLTSHALTVRTQVVDELVAYRDTRQGSAGDRTTNWRRGVEDAATKIRSRGTN